MSLCFGLSNYNNNNHLYLNNNNDVKNDLIKILKKELFKVINFLDENVIELKLSDNEIVFESIIKLLNKNFTINQQNKTVINENYILGLLEIYNFILINKSEQIIVNIS